MSACKPLADIQAAPKTIPAKRGVCVGADTCYGACFLRWDSVGEHSLLLSRLGLALHVPILDDLDNVLAQKLEKFTRRARNSPLLRPLHWL